MKSHLHTVLAVYAAIHKDLTAIWPEHTRDFGKDLSYLQRSIEDRGLPYVLVTLPDVAKALDRALGDGRIDYSTLPPGYPKPKASGSLWSVLWTKIFDSSGNVYPDASTDAIASLRQLLLVFKKYRVDCPTEATVRSVQQFFEVDASLPSPIQLNGWKIPTKRRYLGHPLAGETTCLERDTRWDIMRIVSDIIVGDIGVPNIWKLVGRHGPGVVSESPVANKYEFGNWPIRLQCVFPFEYFGNGILDTEHNYTEREQFSSLKCVPKTYKGPRIICAEPLSHMWIQQSIWMWLDKRIPHTLLSKTITFRSQEKSQQRALLASADGKLATIDLSSASDRVSARLVEWVFGNSDLLTLMWACRTHYVVQNVTDLAPKGKALNMYAPAGSAMTFPIQSIVFAIMCITADLISSKTEPSTKTVRKAAERITVFGDDLIVPIAAVPHLVDILGECGLVVNTHKSHWTGKFREACGVDAYNGVMVTPTYIPQPYTGSGESTSSLVEASNNLYKAGYWNTADALLELLPPSERKLLMVVRDQLTSLGLFSFCGDSNTHLKKVWNRDLQRYDSIALGIESKCTKTRGRGYADLTQYFTEDPSAQDPLTRGPWEAGYGQRPSIRKKKAKVGR